jgi:hypothetical protein
LQKNPTTNDNRLPSPLSSLVGTNFSLLLYGFSYTICDFATNKTEKKYEVSQNLQKNTELSRSLTNFRLSFKRRQQKKSRIGLLHRNQFAEGIQLT